MNNISPERVFSVNAEQFDQLALDVFQYQATHCSVYRKFIENLNRRPEQIRQVDDIPFLPIEFFKTHPIVTQETAPYVIFSSSGTTGMAQSRHYVSDISVYELSFREGFRHFYGDICQYTILALLPSYQEREGSSLIYMVDRLIQESNDPSSGYFLYDHDALYTRLREQKISGRKTILIGVTYALLDFVEAYQVEFPDLIVMETGGMKGRRPEMLREELHQELTRGFGVPVIHSEYGMTELLSQAYSRGGGVFNCPPWMKVKIREMNDPFTYLQEGRTGGLNIIDLANLNSCSFIATQDLGRYYSDGSFEVLGRFDNSDIRGCNLLVQ